MLTDREGVERRRRWSTRRFGKVEVGKEKPVSGGNNVGPTTATSAGRMVEKLPVYSNQDRCDSELEVARVDG